MAGRSGAAHGALAQRGRCRPPWYFCVWTACLLWAGCPGSVPAPPPPRDWPAGELHPGGTVTAELAPGQVHRYRLALEADHFLRLVVDQQGVDLVATLHDPRNELLLRADRPFGDRGPELLLALAGRSGVHTLTLQAGETGGPGRYQATIEKLAPATAQDRRAAEAYRLFSAGESLAGEEAMRCFRQALATWRELDETLLEVEVLEAIGKRYWQRGDWAGAAESYRAAIAALGDAGHRRWEMVVRPNLASMDLPLGEAEEARQQYQAILALARQQGDHTTMAQALHGLGQAYQNQGELQKSLDHYEQALALWPPGDERRPYTLHGLGVLHSLHFHNPSRGRELLAAARDAWPASQERFKARTLEQLGRLAVQEGRTADALRHLEAALAIEPAGDPCGRAVLLAQIGLVEEAVEESTGDGADLRLAQAREILGEHTCPRSETTVELLAANRAEKRRDLATALAGYRRCRERFESRGDRLGLAEALLGVARVERARRRPEAARAASGRALEILEGIRPQVLREDLRTGFFSTVQDPFELHVELALETGDPEAAWATAERARARALQDLLLEAGAGLRRAVDAEPAVRERALQHRLNALETRRLAEADPGALAALQREMDALVEELERARGEIRRRSPAYAALTQPRPPSLAEVQEELLDDGTLLLEYRLGAEASTLWAVTAGSFAAFRLPPRRQIEPLALEAAAWLRSLRWPDAQPAVLCELSQKLLAPAADLLAGRRLVVVPDGALATLPFAALPHPTAGPCPQAPPLVASHEIAYLPSAAALTVQRRRLAGRQAAPGWLAVVADPVYGPGDERLGGAGAGNGAAGNGAAAGRGGGDGAVRTSLRRLPHSAAEAAEVLAGLPEGRTFLATGFGASRETVTGGALAGFRVVHFATHGVLDAEEPLLSHLALSQLDRHGRAVDGNLAAHEIYDLDLPAELVVLSACDTALGRQVPGEGLVSGLPRAFLYAGAARVLMSLWAVPDEGTHQLMTRFYQGLLADGLPPARALQEAQRSLWRSGLPPYQWAGFVLQGDWRPLPPFS